MMTLSQIRKILPKSKWSHTRILEDIGVALDIGMTPNTFWDLDEEDQAYILAYRRAIGTIEAYENYLQEKKAKKRG